FPVNDGPTGQFGRIRIEPERPTRILDPNTLRWRSEPAIRVVLAHSDLVVVGFVSISPGTPPGVPGIQLVLEPDLQAGSRYAFREDRFVFGTTGNRGFFR